MLDPPLATASGPTIIPFVMNARPFYDTIELGSDPDSITVDAILERAAQSMGYWLGFTGLRLRWIIDESATFSAKHSVDQGSLELRERDACRWYLNGGHCLASEPITTDDSLRKRLKLSGGSTGAGDIALYVVAPATLPGSLNGTRIGVERARFRYITYHVPQARERGDGDDSGLTRMAALYEPAFAYAENALRNLQDAKANGGTRNESNANSVDVHPGDGDKDETLDARLLMAQLREALNNLNMARSNSGELEGGHAEALGKLFRQLVDDPTLEVKIKSQGVSGDRSAELEIEGRCPTPYGIPALYVVGKDKLVSPCDTGSEGAAGVSGGMLAYRDAILKKNCAPVYEATCCPCLVVGTAGTTIQLYAAYFADRIFRTHLCDFAPDTDGNPNDVHPDIVSLKVQVVRHTARMLREAYAKVHIGDLPQVYTPRPHLVPQPSIVMPAPLSESGIRLRRFNRVVPPEHGDVFAGLLKLPTRDDELPVHVKFVDAYCVAAHRLLAEHRRNTADGSGSGSGSGAGEPWPLAPQLYWAGEIAAGLMMIVMETLPRDVHTLCWYTNPTADEEWDSDRWSEPNPAPVAWNELEDVRAAVQLLHAHDFVHGDIRPQNVMLQRLGPAADASGRNSKRAAASGDGAACNTNSGAPAPRAYLIDFDGAGKEGEVRYSARINPDVEWPRPASELRGQLITKEDDMSMLERLLPQVSLESGREPGHERGDNLNVEKRKRKRDPDTGKRKRKHKHKQEDTLDKET